MKTFNRILFLLAFLYLLNIHEAMSQVSVNTNGSAPDPSAMLEVSSDNKGLLLPRIDFNNRPASPAIGLLIYVISNGPLGNGLYLFDGSGWLKLNATNAFSIGQHYGGGVIFNIDPSGQHGYISAETDQPGIFEYGCNTDSIYGANGTEMGTGLQNTADIIAACPTPEIAARVCDTSTQNGYTDWFLPSRDEIDSMYVHKVVIGGFGNLYWSSTQQSTPAAWVGVFDAVPPDGHVGWTNKSSTVYVRCVRKF